MFWVATKISRAYLVANLSLLLQGACHLPPPPRLNNPNLRSLHKTKALKDTLDLLPYLTITTPTLRTNTTAHHITLAMRSLSRSLNILPCTSLLVLAVLRAQYRSSLRTSVSKGTVKVTTGTRSTGTKDLVARRTTESRYMAVQLVRAARLKRRTSRIQVVRRT